MEGSSEVLRCGDSLGSAVAEQVMEVEPAVFELMARMSGGEMQRPLSPNRWVRH
jgi:hypothetical protein